MKISSTRVRSEDGAAVVAVLLLVGALTVLALVASGVAGIVIGHRRVQAAADLAALAAAEALGDGGDTCAVAASLAASNGATSQECTVAGSTVTVVVGLKLPVSLGGRWVTARARAGPT